MDAFLRDRAATIAADGGFQLGSLNSALNADGQVVDFESEAALIPRDSEFPIDVFAHDEQP